MNFWFDANKYSSIFTKNAIKKPELGKHWLASWRDIEGLVHHDILYKAETNNQAEYGSMLMVLHHIRSWTDYMEHEDDHNIWLEEAIIYGDSQLVINQMTGKYKVKEEDLKNLWIEGISLVHVLKADFGIDVKFRWVKRDINNEALGLKGKIKDPGPE